MGNAAWTLAKPDCYLVTAQMNINYIRPAWEGETLFAIGEVLHAGAQTFVTRAEVRTSDDKLIATGSATFMQVPHPKGAEENIPRRTTPKG
jgi:uncharacterized protein (TIGR00369 family)